MSSSGSGPATRSLRRDVQGLRAVAILAVVAYHARLPGLSGGYTGVDVFFVISGFVITGELWRELHGGGRVALGAFWSRRLRRLLPLAAVVVLATVGLARLVVPRLELPLVVGDARAAILYGSNLHFAQQGNDYLASSATPRPLLHTWSLGIEEQFYLVWPVLLLLFWRWGRRRAIAVAGLIGVTCALSLAVSVHLTGSDPTWAFYSPLSRAWQLGLGAIVAVLADGLRRRLDVAAAALLTWGGSSMVVIGQITIGRQPYPGWVALVPTVGTVAVIAGGCARPARGAIKLLAWRPLQSIAAISYGWYLWHWPMIILTERVLGHRLAVVPAVALMAAAAGLAWLTLLAVERPLRRAGSLGQTRWALPAAAITTASVVLAVTLVGHSLAALPAPGGLVAAPAALSAGSVLPAPVTRARAKVADLAATAHAVAVGAESVQLLPANLSPSLDAAAGDKAAPFNDGCHLGYRETQSPPCTYGDTRSATTVVLFGDSHATQWFPALLVIAQKRHWRLLDLTKSICPPLHLALWQPGFARPYRECDAWRDNVEARLKAVHPALVILGAARHYGPEFRITPYDQAWTEGLSATVHTLAAAGPQVVVLGPTPKPREDVPACLARHTSSARRCATWRSTAVRATGAAAESAATLAAGGSYLDVSPWLCGRVLCPAVMGNLLVYRDDNHLTTTITTWLAPVLGEALDRIMLR